MPGKTLLPVVLALAVCAAYADGFRGVFLFDDVPYLVDNPAIRTLWPPTALTWNSLRPVSFYSFAFSHALGGYDVWAYHALNVAFHVAAALALFGFARRALRLPRVGLSEYASTATAFAVALLWAVHPLNTEAVTYVIQRAEVMAGLAWVLALYCLMRAAETGDAGSSRRWCAGTALAFYGGLGCKEVAATIPLIVYLCDALLVTGSFAEPLRRRWGLYAALAAPFVVVPVVWLAVAPSRFGALRASPDSPAPLDYVWTQPAVILGYLRRVVWPVGLNLDPGWDPAEHRDELPWAAALVGAALLATVEAVRRRAPVGWLGAAFFLALAPSSSFHPLSDRMAEHRMYVAAIPCLALVALGSRRALALVRAPAVRRTVAAAVLAAAAGGLGAATYARNLDYSGAVRMWTDVVAKAPHNARGHYNLGCAVLAEGGALNEDRALAEFREALRLRPAYVGAHNNAGAIFFRRRNYEEAAEHFRAALASGDAPAELLRNYGYALMELRRYDDAAAVLLRVEERLAEAPQNRATAARLSQDIGVCLAKTGAPDDALARLRRVVDLDPSLDGARTRLAGAFAAAGRVVEAIDVYLAAVAADPSATDARVALVALCVDERNRAVARAHLEEIVRRGPPDAEAARVLEFVRRAK